MQVKSGELAPHDAKTLLQDYYSNRAAPHIPSDAQTRASPSAEYPQEYIVRLHGNEFFLCDHVIQGKRILPGAAQLEIARSAIVVALGLPPAGGVRISMSRVIWLHPIEVGEAGVVLCIRVCAAQHGKFRFEIRQQADSTLQLDRSETLYAQGLASLAELPQQPLVDVSRWQRLATLHHTSAEQFYERYRRSGIDYGVSHRGVISTQRGVDEAGAPFVLGKLHLPGAIASSAAAYAIHPSILDSALQTTFGLSAAPGSDSAAGQVMATWVPYSLDELEVYGPISDAAWVVVHEAKGSSAQIRKFDLQLFDAQGSVCARLRAFTSRVLPANTAANTLLLCGEWRSQAAGRVLREGESSCDEKWIFLDPAFERVGSAVLRSNAARIVVLTHDAGSVENRVRAYARQTLEMTQQLLAARPSESRILLQVVLPDSADGVLLSSLSGMLRSIVLETAKLDAQVLLMEQHVGADTLFERLQENEPFPEDVEIRYREGLRQIWKLREMSMTNRSSVISPWKDSGVYLISGGAGRLGLLFADAALRASTSLRVVLLGRSPGDSLGAAARIALASSGGRLEYRCVDVDNVKKVQDCVDEIVGLYGHIDGVIHAAGGTSDGLAIHKTHAVLDSVLAPKISGIRNLDVATRHLTLEWFAAFSSTASVFGNVAQSDYALGNAFMDRYLIRRNDEVARGARRGRSVSLNWPLWQDGGMTVSDSIKERTRANKGTVPLPTLRGLAAFQQALASTENQVVVLFGDVSRIRARLLANTPDPNAPAEPRSAQYEPVQEIAIEKVQSAIAGLISRMLKVKIDDVDFEAEFSEFGFDSVSLTEFANHLYREHEIDVTPAIFFEYATVKKFSEYLIKDHGEMLKRRAEFRNHGNLRQLPPQEEPPRIQSIETTVEKFAAPAAPFAHAQDAVAIVGMSGCFPGAANVDEFWANLSAGKDSIVEIPRDRWDWEAVYGDPKVCDGKTNVKWGGFIEGVAEFDSLFFGISPHEAQLMDPQQRLLLTYGWKAIEDAAQSPLSLAGTRTAIFVATTGSGYASLIAQAGAMPDGSSATGTVPSLGPNRLSYFLDLRGPSEPIETACSSSLVAVHRGVRSIAGGESDMALVGGISVILTPTAHISFSKAGMLSPDGRCKTFSRSANGYVRGEGVGMLFLKRLSFAERDRNHVYGVIRTSGQNHGGRANSLTAPNPRAQADLIRTAYSEAGIHAQSVGYIEAHGTGTSLGDPIEINALKIAFAELRESQGGPDYPILRHYCGVGSVKTNIGHLELAAGVAGVIKVLLQLKHRTLVRSLHCEDVNPYIQLADSPFYLVRENEPWKAIYDAEGRELPRRAGISSFGFGGANAHILIEEFLATPRQIVKPSPGCQAIPALIVLSAKNAARLVEVVAQLAEFVSKNASHDINIIDLAYTLQVGREAMEHRLAFMAASLPQLDEMLRSLAARGAALENIPDTYFGDAKRGKNSLSVLAADDDLQQLAHSWIVKGKFEKLLDAWTRGVSIDWRLLYEGRAEFTQAMPRRMALPTYPFARVRHWVKKRNDGGAVPDRGPLRPKLDASSDPSARRFTCKLSGAEFFLADHRVGDSKVLPAVACLELVHAAVIQAATVPPDAVLRVSNIAWLSPVAVTHAPALLTLRLHRRGTAHFKFQINSDEEKSPNGGTASTVTHCQGEIAILDPDTDEESQIDVASLRADSEREVSPEMCYSAYSASAIHYGPSHRAMSRLRLGEMGGNAYVIADLNLPGCVADTQDDYFLHPSIFDSALQAACAFKVDGDFGASQSGETQPWLPFSVDSVSIRHRLTKDASACLRTRAATSSDDHPKLDIDIYDTQGRAAVTLRGLSLRRRAVKPAISGYPEPTMFVPTWDVVKIPGASPWPVQSQSILVLGGTLAEQRDLRLRYPNVAALSWEAMDAESLMNELDTRPRIQHIFWIAPPIEDSGATGANDDSAAKYFRVAKTLASSPLANRELGLTVVTYGAAPVGCDAAVRPDHAFVHGMVGSLVKEHPKWALRLVDLPSRHWPIDELLRIAPDSGAVWAYRDAVWQRPALIPYSLPHAMPTPYRRGGVYVVLGGAGGLGEVFSEHLMRTCDAQMVWLGRSPMGEAIDAKISRLATIGHRPRYIQADATKPDELEKALSTIKASYGSVNGVVHSAIVLHDKSVAQLDERHFLDVLAAKREASVNLVKVFSAENPDFFLFFSSWQSFSKSSGQANYAAACTFKDAFAHSISRLSAAKIRIVNWGFWGSVGAVASEAYRKRMAQIGIGSIEAPCAMAALDKFIAGPVVQIGLIQLTGTNLPNDLRHNSLEQLQLLAPRAPGHSDSGEAALRRVKPWCAPDELEVSAKETLDGLIARLLHAQLRDAGLRTGLPALPGMLGPYQRWLTESIRALGERGLIDETVNAASGVSHATANETWVEWEEKKPLWRGHSHLGAQADLAEATLRGLPAILTGRLAATDVLFPAGSLDRVERIYRDAPVTVHFNSALAEIVADRARNCRAEHPEVRLRILEIGAGTGATTASVLKALIPLHTGIEEYCYSDVSPVFLAHAQDCFAGEHSYLRTRLLNIETSPALQGVESGTYDIVIATNVLHATADIRSTVRHAKCLLKNGGVLLINELCKHTLFSHVTFGLLPGWWLFDDPELRMRGGPGLAPETWRRVLEDEGFVSVVFPMEQDRQLGLQLIMAQSNGVIRLQPVRRGGNPSDTGTLETPARRCNAPEVRKATTPPDDEGSLENAIVSVLASILKMDASEIDAGEAFSEYGLDSIMIIRAVDRLNDELGVDLNTTALFDYGSVKKLARHLSSNPLRRSVQVSTVRVQRETSVCDALAMNIQSAADSPPPATPVRSDAIAIIGLSGRYSGVENVNELWDALLEQKNLVGDCARWTLPESGGKNAEVSPQGGFVPNIDQFDPLFFGISGTEATYMDPQQRLLLEESWKALEDAGYAGAAVDDRPVGVYVGCSAGDYSRLLPAVRPAQAFWGNATSVIPGRVAYHLNLRGPAIAIDTACSSSLVAVHLACQALNNSQIELALAGGAFLQCTTDFHRAAERAGMISPTHACHAFDDRADGFVPGEGVGMIVLKRLSQAIADGDNIHGVILGSGVNQDGATNGITAPSALSQERLEREVYETAGIDPSQISMLEAHGTGTKLGDPIEFQALSRAFARDTSLRNFCALGSIKTNIGHAATAAGIAGITRILLALRHNVIPASRNFSRHNPNIDLPNSPFYINAASRAWLPSASVRRCAAVSSFGFSGTNAHLVIEEAPHTHGRVSPHKPYLVVLSAATPSQQVALVDKMILHLEDAVRSDCGNLSFTLMTGRRHMPCRLACVAADNQSLRRALHLWRAGEKPPTVLSSEVQPAAVAQHSTLRVVGNRLIAELNQVHGTEARSALLMQIADLYVKGVELDYATLFVASEHSRVSLPGYPFLRERYWVKEAPAVELSASKGFVQAAPATTVGEAPTDGTCRTMRLLTKLWQEAPLTVDAGAAFQHAVILSSHRTNPLAQDLAKQFTHARIVDVETMDGCTFDTEISAATAWIDVVGCEAEDTPSQNWLALLQRWIRAGRHEDKCLLGVTRGLQACGPGTPTQNGAARAGIYRSMQGEYVGLRCLHVDVDSDATAASIRQIVDCELPAVGVEREICYRSGVRWGGIFHEACLDASQSFAPKSQQRFSPRGVLWITGGTGALGLLCAQHFVREYGVRHVVLMGRQALPRPEQWVGLCNEVGPRGDKIRGLLALRREGVNVKVSSIGLTDREALSGELARVNAEWGPAEGVIHCAGTVDVKTPAFIMKTQDDIQATLEPKITGLNAILDVFQDQPLKYCLLFSSVCAVLPSLAAGVMDYAMGNAYLDYTAQSCSHRLPLISVQWPKWQDAGMKGGNTPAYERTGLLQLSNREALRFIDAILALRPAAVVLPAVVDDSRWAPTELLRTATCSPSPKRTCANAAPQLTTEQRSSSELERSLCSRLRAMASEVLGIDQARLSVDRSLQDYGADSVMLQQLLAMVGALLNARMDPSIFYEHPTLGSLATALTDRYAERVTRVCGEATSEGGVADPKPSAACTTDALGGLEHEAAASDDDIAVIGMSCKFPGAGDLEQYWRLLLEGRSALRNIADSRWGSSTQYAAGVLDDIDSFDAKYFNLAESDVAAMDPQALILLEESLRLLCHAGYTQAEIKGSAMGVYIGARTHHRPSSEQLQESKNPIVAAGNNYIAANISRFFDLRGPSVLIDTACSSALAAMSMGVLALKSRAITSAMIGGVNLLQSGAALRMFERRGILQTSPQFHIFDARSEGAVLAEGVGLVLLKTYRQAVLDGDRVYALVKGIATNNDGRTPGPSAPSLQAQTAVMLAALEQSGKSPAEVEYIEVNGSGSEVSDLVELKSVETAYRNGSKLNCYLGSMKPNIGHPLCAEGIASFLKVVLMLERRMFVPFLSATEPMEHYDFKKSPFRFSRAAAPWENERRVAAVNCFGDGGTNVHVVVESAPRPASSARRERLPPPKLHRIAVRSRARIDVVTQAPAAHCDEFLINDATLRQAAASRGQKLVQDDVPLQAAHRLSVWEFPKNDGRAQ
jgi:polyketide synthase PksM